MLTNTTLSGKATLAPSISATLPDEVVDARIESLCRKSADEDIEDRLVEQLLLAAWLYRWELLGRTGMYWLRKGTQCAFSTTHLWKQCLKIHHHSPLPQRQGLGCRDSDAARYIHPKQQIIRLHGGLPRAPLLSPPALWVIYPPLNPSS